MSTDPEQPAAPPSAGGSAAVRRPPAPTSPRASVTPLVAAQTAAEDVPLASVQGTLALDLGRAADRRASGPGLRLEDEPLPAGPGEAEVRAWAGRFAQAVVEVLGGDRPVAQLLRCTTARVYQEVGRRVQILSRTAAAPQRRRTLRAQVRSVRVFQPTSRSAEVCVHVAHGMRSRALAARLEHRDGRWTCTALQIG